MRTHLLRSLRAASIALLLPMAGCVDPEQGGGSTSGTALYVFDGIESPTGGRIKIWNDANALYTDPLAAPNRSLRGSILDKVKTLGWGGMCLDTRGSRLYLVSESGDVVRIERIQTQNGELTSTIDIVNFSLGSGSADRLAGGKFGQAAFDPSNDTLYVTETNDSEARIWVVPAPELYSLNAVVTRNTINIPGDKQGTGVAAWQGAVYSYFGDGNAVVGTDLTQYSGPRLRKGSASTVQATLFPLVGDNTLLANYGALAFDSGNNQLYVARHLTATGKTGAPILIYSAGQFTSGLNQAPDKNLGLGQPGMGELRVLAHGGNKDWLAAASSEGGSPGQHIYLWRNPLSSTAARDVNLAGSAVRGLAFDGSN